TRGHIGAATDANRSHHLAVAADKGVILDHCAVLALAVDDPAIEITSHEAAADVHLPANLGIAQVREVRNARGLSNPRFLKLNKVPDLGLRPHLRAGSQMGVRPDLRLRADFRFLAHGAGFDVGAYTDAHVLEHAVGSDLSAFGNAGGTQKHR